MIDARVIDLIFLFRILIIYYVGVLKLSTYMICSNRALLYNAIKYRSIIYY